MQEAQWQAAKANLVPCRNCQRRFAPDRLGVHERVCRGTKKPSPRDARDEEEISVKRHCATKDDVNSNSSNGKHNGKEPKNGRNLAMGNSPRGNSFSVDRNSYWASPREQQSTEFDHSAFGNQQKPATKSSTNYQGKLYCAVSYKYYCVTVRNRKQFCRLKHRVKH